MDYADDIAVSERGIKEMSEAYRKIRNTFRYLLGNLEDFQRFDPSDMDLSGLHEIDRWALGQLNRVIRDVRAAYERFEFYRVYQRIYQFCVVELSSFYLDVLKDRLYAEAPASPDRRSAQFVLARLHDVLTRLLAPIIPHTADESWDYRPAGPEGRTSVHLAEFPEPDPVWDDADHDLRWDEVIRLREQVLVSLEGPTEEQADRQRQEAKIRITTSRPDRWLPDRDLLATLCIVSEVEIVADPSATHETVEADRSSYSKCERCWNYRPSVGQNAEYPTLCDRCVRVVTELNAQLGAG